MNKLCSGHSTDLFSALRRKGMRQHFHPERAAAFAREWVAGELKKGKVDVYVVSVMEINAKCSQMRILLLPEACPLCIVNRFFQRGDAAEKWIDNVTDAMVVMCRVNDLRLETSVEALVAH